MTHDVVVADVRLPKRYRYSMYIGILFAGMALLLTALVIIPVVRTASHRQAVFNAEALCRAKITNATTAVNAALIADEGDLFKALIIATIAGTKLDPASTKAVGDEFTRDTAIAAVLKPIQLDAINICHRNPAYALPATALNSGVP